MLRARRGLSSGPPDANDEYLFYQLLVASWPAEFLTAESPEETALAQYRDRVKEAMRKSIREAKVHSTWAAPQMEYEDAVMAFIDAALDPKDSQAFLSAFQLFEQQVARQGVENSLVATVLKLTTPGVPDIYQGAELWELSLVDPDNRRPVDYATRSAMLADLDTRKPSVAELMQHWQDGAVKMFVTSSILRFRAQAPELFENGAYDPVLSTGAKADCLCAFTRCEGRRWLLVIAARFPARRLNQPGWGDTTLALPPQLASASFRNLLTGARLSARDIEDSLDLVFESLPVAVLTASLP